MPRLLLSARNGSAYGQVKSFKGRVARSIGDRGDTGRLT